MLKKISKDLNSIKKNSVRNEGYTSWNNNLQGPNSRVGEAKNEIINLEYKEAKKQPVRTARRKKNPKKMRMV